MMSTIISSLRQTSHGDVIRKPLRKRMLLLLCRCYRRDEANEKQNENENRSGDVLESGSGGDCDESVDDDSSYHSSSR